MPLRNYGPIFRQASSVPAFEPVEQLLRHRRGERLPSLARHREQLAQQLGSLAEALRGRHRGGFARRMYRRGRNHPWKQRARCSVAAAERPDRQDRAVKLARYADHAGLRLRVE